MIIYENASLLPYNTLKLDAKARYIVELESINDINVFRDDNRFSNLPVTILGGGSNVLITQDIDGVVVHPTFSNIQILEENDDHVLIDAEAGKIWHELVTFAVDNNWGGIENMALIPGSVGAAPVQNIAAYGQNFVDAFDSLDTIDLTTGVTKTFEKKDCDFGYRSSIFKQDGYKNVLITNVRIRLHKKHQLSTNYFQMHVSYDSIKGELEQIASEPYSIKDVYNAVINIRSRKLLNPETDPTIGSFFLNPVISKTKLVELQHEIEELQVYPIDNLNYQEIEKVMGNRDDYVKIPAGRIIDEAGWRGKTVGNCSVSDKHALIFTHNGNATAHEFTTFVNMIKNDIKEKYGIDLESEVVTLP